MRKSPLEQFDENIAKGLTQEDSVQRFVMEKLQDLYSRYENALEKGFSKHLKKIFRGKKTLKGLYLWGEVGRGKTYLMDVFYESLPGKRKYRIHFHEFMRDIHIRLKQLQGTEDPLKTIAKEYCQKIDILCFDEFFVSDITDAMVMRELFTALFEGGMILVATSNVEPKNLYLHGLQRELFLPTIALLEKYVDIVPVNSKQDYRLRELTEAGVYFHPANELSHASLKILFDKMSMGVPVETGEITVEGRQINTVAYTPHAAWFRFEDLCHVPRSQRDYLEIAKQFPVIILENVPMIKEHEDNKVTYLIRLIDVLYDNRVKLVISAEANVDELYTKGRLAFEFMRTKSRLIEMQSEEYLGQAHFL